MTLTDLPTSGQVPEGRHAMDDTTDCRTRRDIETLYAEETGERTGLDMVVPRPGEPRHARHDDRDI